MKRQYTRSEKETYLIDVVGYDQDYLAEASIYEINSLLSNKLEDFEGYMA